jgi:hypothetical protein
MPKCQCFLYCGGPVGPGKDVSQKTYNAHAAARIQDHENPAWLGQEPAAVHGRHAEDLPDQEMGGGDADLGIGINDLLGGHGGEDAPPVEEDPPPQQYREDLLDDSDDDEFRPRMNHQHLFEPRRSPSPPINPNQHAQDEPFDQDLLDLLDLPDRPPRPPAPRPPTANPHNLAVPHRADLRQSMEMVCDLRDTTFENIKIPQWLRTCIETAPSAFDIASEDEKMSLEIYMDTASASREVYTKVCDTIEKFTPGRKLLSHARITSRIREWTKLDIIRHDMCISNCVAFTSIFANLDACPRCSEPRYETIRREGRQKRVPRKQFFQIPIAPQLQARWNTQHGARQMKYAYRELEKRHALATDNGGVSPEYQDVFCGSDLLRKFKDAAGAINAYDTLLMFSMDGAQIYRNKQSDTFIGNLTVFNLPPDRRYKKIAAAPAYVVPGPGKIEDSDSFAFPTFAELCVLMDKGLAIRDGDIGTNHTSIIHLIFAGADGVAMTQMLGNTGHVGFHSCRWTCPMPGRLQPSGGTYYPVLAKPTGYARQKGNHPDIVIDDIVQWHPSQETYLEDLNTLLLSRTDNEFDRNRLVTGLTKPSLLLGLPDSRTLGVPNTAVSDWMHLPGIIVLAEIIPLLRGTLKCDPSDDKGLWAWAQYLADEHNWQESGRRIAALTPYFPSSFGRAPRNPAKSLNTGYKAIEGIHYLFGAGPMEFRRLELEDWRNICRLVRIYDILDKDKIISEKLLELLDHVLVWQPEFEARFVQKHPGRVHFVRPWVHTILHMVTEVTRVGPPLYYAQWTIERLIGILEEDLKLHSNPYANLAMNGLRLCQSNVMMALIPSLAPKERVFTDADIDLGSGYALLHTRDRVDRALVDAPAQALRAFIQKMWPGQPAQPEMMHVLRYGRAALPNGQIVCSAWQESRKTVTDGRSARFVKVCISCSDLCHTES